MSIKSELETFEEHSLDGGGQRVVVEPSVVNFKEQKMKLWPSMNSLGMVKDSIRVRSPARHDP